VKRNRKNRQKRGIALISVLLVLLLLTIIAFGLIFMTDTDTAINSNYRSEQQAFFAAKTGIEEVRDRMRRTAPNSLDAKAPAISLLPDTIASDSGGVLYVINQGADPIPVQPWTAGNKYQDDEFCHDGYTLTGIPNPFTGNVPSDDVPCPNPPNGPSTWYTQPTSAAPAPGWTTSTIPFNSTDGAVPYKWARITWKEDNSVQGSPSPGPYYTVDGTATNSSTATTPVCWDGKKEVLLQTPATICEAMNIPMRPVYLVTSLAYVRGSRRMIQAELAKTVLPNVPAALALDGPNPVWNSYSSNNSQIIGNDASSTPCPPAGNKPAIGVYDSAAVTTVSTALFRPNNYTGTPPKGGLPSVINIGPTGVAPNAPGSGGNLNQLAYVSGLTDLVNTVTQAADNVVPVGGGIPAAGLGTDANPLITVFQGSVSLSGHNVVIGAGILLVEGTLNISGSPEFDGLVLVIGDGVYYGSGDAVFGGQVLVANINSGVVGPTPGPPIVNLSGGGGAGGTYYNSCLANLGNDRIPYRILATREIQY